MKVKLLKKIRKRYSIHRVDNKQDLGFMDPFKRNIDTPYYVLIDEYDSEVNWKSFKTLNDACDVLVQHVVADWRSRIKLSRSKVTKVWHRDNIKNK